MVTYGDTPLLTARTLAAPGRRARAPTATRSTVLTAAGARPHRLRPDRPRPRTARSARSSSRRTPTRGRSARSARSTPGCTPSTRALLRRRARPGRPPTTRRARSTSPTSLAILREAGHRVGAVRGQRPPARSPASTTGCSSPRPAAMLNDRLLRRAMLAGVDRRRPGLHLAGRRGGARARTPWCTPDTQLRGATRVGAGAEVGPELHAHRHRGRRRRAGRAQHRRRPAPRSAPQATVGPFAYLRPGTRLGARREGRHVRRDEERRRSARAPRCRT